VKKNKILIVGGVAGGATSAARLRRLDENAEIIVFERGEFISFANCGLPYYIGGVITSRDALLLQTPEGMKSKYNVDVRVFSEVTSINREEKTLTVKNLETNKTYQESYDYVILSTGAFPVKPPIPGIQEASNLFTLRNIPDVDKIKEFIDSNKPKSATVIGAGFIGIEMAENLHHLGIDVTIVEMADQVMTPVDAELAEILHAHIRSEGVKLILSDGLKSFSNEGKTITLNSGITFNTELIIFSIGVRPENMLAKNAGLNIGARGGVQVNNKLQTNDQAIYAIGDVIEVEDFVSHSVTMIPLAGPANKQARIAANNICGGNDTYDGTMGTAVAKVFEYTVGSTGNNEKVLKAQNRKYQAIHIHPGSHAGYYPGSQTITMKVLYDPETLEILGAGAVGMDGVDKRIDVLATAMRAKMKVTDLKDLELSYAPPFGSAKDPVNMVGFVAENIQKGLVQTESFEVLPKLQETNEILLDVREVIENELGSIPGSINIPLSVLRERVSELPKDKTIYVFCQVGLRGYIASRILTQLGYKNVNLDGGYKTYLSYFEKGENSVVEDTTAIKGEKAEMKEIKQPATVKSTISVDACGLQCPGPIVMVYKTLQDMNEGEVLEIKASDPGFMKDIHNWTAKTGNTLIDVHREEKTIYATIQKGTNDLKENKDVVVSNSKENTTIVVFSEDLDKAIAAFIIAQGAASMGKKVSLFFTFWGLNILRKPKKVKVKKTFIEKMFGGMMPRGTEKLPISKMNMMGMGPQMIKSIMKKKNVDSLQLLMQNAMSLGVKITACAMSMDIMGIKKEELIEGIDIAGVASYLADTTEANHNLFI